MTVDVGVGEGVGASVNGVSVGMCVSLCVQAPGDDDDSDACHFHNVAVQLRGASVGCPVPKHTMKQLDLSGHQREDER